MHTKHINSSAWADRRFVECQAAGKYNDPWAVES